MAITEKQHCAHADKNHNRHGCRKCSCTYGARLKRGKDTRSERLKPPPAKTGVEQLVTALSSA